MDSSEQIKQFILENLSGHQKDIIKASIRKFGLSRQAILKHMHTLINEERVVAHGKTRDRFYELKPIVNFTKTINLNEPTSAYAILKSQILPNLKIVRKNIFEICEYSFRAILVNAMDHAQATKLNYKLFISPTEIHFVLNDNGIGIFEKLNQSLSLNNTKIAAVEIAKGHITTDPENHSGDELMTVIHLFDKVKIDASGIRLVFQNKQNEWNVFASSQQKGTRIHLEIKTNSKRTCQKVFHQIFEKEYNMVRIPVNLIREKNEQVNSRIQAQSLLHNIRNISKIEFDFQNIELIGPAFADELVRKTKQKNQFADIKWINSNKIVDVLMSRAMHRLT
ncbi:MAG: hypothetical protein CMG57_02920 [Candidatus Marinimicrobia bacterium]|nr:hypothetical protein [Candidatus Neomarinimicrobiota bacterium]